MRQTGERKRFSEISPRRSEISARRFPAIVGKSGFLPLAEGGKGPLVGLGYLGLFCAVCKAARAIWCAGVLQQAYRGFQRASWLNIVFLRRLFTIAAGGKLKMLYACRWHGGRLWARGCDFFAVGLCWVYACGGDAMRRVYASFPGTCANGGVAVGVATSVLLWT